MEHREAGTGFAAAAAAAAAAFWTSPLSTAFVAWGRLVATWTAGTAGPGCRTVAEREGEWRRGWEAGGMGEALTEAGEPSAGVG